MLPAQEYILRSRHFVAATMDKSFETKDFEDFICLIGPVVRISVDTLVEPPQWIAEDLFGRGAVRIEGNGSESIGLMNTHVGRLDRLLVDSLVFSRVGRMQDCIDIHLDEALNDVLEQLKILSGFRVFSGFQCKRPQFGQPDIPSFLPALLSNAVVRHDLNTGDVAVQFRLESNEVMITVADDLPGTPVNCRERVFYTMATLRPRREIEGSRVALMIARKSARLYGGSLAVTGAREGLGATAEARVSRP